MYLLFIVLIGLGIYFLFKDRTDLNFNRRKSAFDIIDERFANGDIDEETYRKMKATLKN